jgi:molybdopterin-guanine dinucleotide biosynthesis protein B
MDNQHPPLVIIAGRSGSGKTSLLERLIPEFKKRGLRVGTIKHHHGDFDIDHPGKDSWRHKNAGAEKTVVSFSRNHQKITTFWKKFIMPGAFR